MFAAKLSNENLTDAVAQNIEESISTCLDNFCVEASFSFITASLDKPLLVRQYTCKRQVNGRYARPGRTVLALVVKMVLSKLKHALTFLCCQLK